MLSKARQYAVYSGERSYTTVWCAMENHANVWHEIPLSYWPGLLGSYYNFARDKLALYRLAGAPQGDLDAHYAEAGLGSRGDNLQPRENILEHKYKCRRLPRRERRHLGGRGLFAAQRLCALGKAQRRDGVSDKRASAPFNRLALSDAPDGTQAALWAWTRWKRAYEPNARCRGWVPPARWRDGVMDEALFFNSNNHLNTQGAQVFTAALVEQLRAVGVGAGVG